METNAEGGKVTEKKKMLTLSRVVSEQSKEMLSLRSCFFLVCSSFVAVSGSHRDPKVNRNVATGLPDFLRFFHRKCDCISLKWSETNVTKRFVTVT